jgi:hypothetical protein
MDTIFTKSNELNSPTMIKIIIPTLPLFLFCLSLVWSCNARTPNSKVKQMTSTYQPTPDTDPEHQKYQTLVEFLLDLQLNQEQGKKLDQYIDTYRHSRDPQRRQVYANCMALHDQLMAMSPEDRKAQARMLGQGIILEQWKEAQKGDEEAQFMLDLYYSAHPPLTQGNLPLTREIIEELMDFDYFFNTTIKGVQAPKPDAAFRQKMYQETIKSWNEMSQEQRMDFWQKAAQVGLYRLKWAYADQGTRSMIRYNVVGEQGLSPTEKQLVLAQLQQMQNQIGGLRNQQWQVLQNEMQYMRQNQQTIMGNGTYYNQTLRRWEQHGGIVTEFH